MLAGLLLLMIGMNVMNVTNSFVGRNFMTAIENRNSAGFTHYAWLFLAVFGGSTLVAVLFRFTEERLQKAKGEPWFSFWENLREGYQQFETKRVVPQITVEQGRYRFR